eukprot:SAG31_NODE_930_length_10920_cov_4.478329_4_plen_271_part_00
MRVEYFDTERRLYAAGVLEPDPKLYIIERGAVILEQPASDRMEGPQFRHLCGEGEMFGEWAMVQRGPRGSSAFVAMSRIASDCNDGGSVDVGKCCCLTLSRSNFDAVLGPLWRTHLPEFEAFKKKLGNHMMSAQKMDNVPTAFETWNGELQTAVELLREATAAALAAGDGADASLHDEVNFWSEVVTTHPSYMDQCRQDRAAWHDKYGSRVSKTCEEFRIAIPANVWEIGRRKLRQMTSRSARFRRRLLSCKVLWLVHRSHAQVCHFLLL